MTSHAITGFPNGSHFDPRGLALTVLRWMLLFRLAIEGPVFVAATWSRLGFPAAVAVVATSAVLVEWAFKRMR